MCLENDGYHRLLTSMEFSKYLRTIIIDEAHCITQWGDKFRDEYSKLGTLRSFVPTTVPFLVTSATLTLSDLVEIRKSIHLNQSETFRLNLGNDRPNITWKVHHMQGARSDMQALRFILPESPTQLKMDQMIIYFNNILLSMEACQWFCEQLPEHLHTRVACYNARRGDLSKDDTLYRFCHGELDILFASEAAGMVLILYWVHCNLTEHACWQGCDIPNVKIVVQFMVPKSLSVWLQRAGRAGRAHGSQATAYLLVQPSVFQEKGKLNVYLEMMCNM